MPIGSWFYLSYMSFAEFKFNQSILPVLNTFTLPVIQ